MARLTVEALHGEGLGPIDLAVAAGECVCLSGPSGCGKTRLLRALADLDPHGGRVVLDGVEAAQVPPPHWRRQVALVPAESRWWAAQVADHFPPGSSPDLSSVGLPQAALQWSVERLSSGERQRLAVLRALALAPQVLLLDEPTANLDAGHIERVEALLAGYRAARAAAVIWVSHDAQQIARVAGRVVHMKDGRVCGAVGVAA